MPHIVCDKPDPETRVVRFVRPDVVNSLYEESTPDHSPLYLELQAAALADLSQGMRVIINLGMIERFPTIFYGLLLEVRKVVQASKARLLLCCLTPNIKECFTLFQGHKVFETTETEAEALAKGKDAPT